MKKSITFALAVFMLPLIVLGDQVPWGPVVGRAGVVSVCQNEFGDKDVTVTLNVKVLNPPDHLSPLPFPVTATCPPDVWSTCEAVNAILGACSKTTNTLVIDQPGGVETCTQTSCVDPHQGRCKTMSGDLTPGLALTSIGNTGGCQF